MTPRAKGILSAVVGTIFWSTTAIFISYLLEHHNIQPLTLAFWRDLLISSALLLFLAVRQPGALRITRRDLPFFVLYGFVGLAVFNGLWSYSVKFNGAAVATVLAYSSPAFTVVLAWLLLREALTLRKIIAIVLSLAGCVLVVEAHRPDVWQVNLTGILVGLGTGLAFAIYSLAGKWSTKRFASPWTVTAYGFLFAALGLMLTQTPQTALSMGPRWDGWLILAVLALVPSLLGFGLYTLSLRYLQAGTAGLIASLEPALTTLMAITLLRRPFENVQWLGMGFILAAVALAQNESTTLEKSNVALEETVMS